ncbi:MAG: Uncharacterised protein [Prochlorococcus marinus str. MIT 9215]|nr:MAG: Uncharacterised protein [Prochlorococcus marinus str. MIT 9215]
MTAGIDAEQTVSEQQLEGERRRTNAPQPTNAAAAMRVISRVEKPTSVSDS